MNGTKRNFGRWGAGVVLLSACGVLAYGTRGEPPVCDVAPARAVKVDNERELLAQKLAQRDAELQELRAQLDARDEQSLYDEALALGIVDAVKASKLPDRQQRRVAIAIVREARLNELDPLLVVAVIRTESSFNNYAVSPVGAMGLMQVMPGTGQWLAERRGLDLGRTSNLFDSELNIELGTGYLAQLIARFGAVDKALVAYNAGPAAAKKILANRASRTKFMKGYPKKVLGEFSKLEKAAQSRMAQAEERPVPDVRG